MSLEHEKGGVRRCAAPRSPPTAHKPRLPSTRDRALPEANAADERAGEQIYEVTAFCEDRALRAENGENIISVILIQIETERKDHHVIAFCYSKVGRHLRQADAAVSDQ